MVDARQVAALLFQVKSATSPVAKVRAVMQAWQVLRAMPPHDRKKVAMELGFEGAEGLVDRVAAEHGGLPPEQIKEALRAAGSSDPADVERLVGSLRDPAARGGALQRGLEKLENLLVHGTTAGEADDAAATPGDAGAAVSPIEAAAVDGSDTGDERPETGPETAGPAPPAAATPPAEVAVATPPRPSATVPAHSVPPPRPVAARQPPARRSGQGAARAAAGVVATVPVTAAARGPRTPLAVEREDVWSSPERRTPPAQADPSPPASGPPVATVQRTPGILARLRRLRSDAASLRNASTSELRTAIEGCGPEWAQRRALLALIEAGAIGEPDVAVELIGGLASRAARRWCLNALIRSADLDAAARARAGAALGI